jgi:tRNA threonylcarbamoyladenosine biosynthesis protein TsaB
VPLLAIDTSAALSVAILDDDGSLLGSVFHDDMRQHAELLAPAIRSLLESARLQPKELTAVAVGTGPGPFTGLRIGLVTAETLAFALNIPIYGACSLEALALAAAAEARLPSGTEIIATLDARRKEVYWARYLVKAGAQLEELVSPQVTAPLDIPSGNTSGLVVGDGALKYGIEGASDPRFPLAEWVGRLALARKPSGIAQPTTPLYLRRPDIQGQTPQAM